MVNLKKIPYSIEGKRMQYITFLESMCVKNAKDIVEEIWEYPNRLLSFEEMIDIIKLNSTQHESKD